MKNHEGMKAFKHEIVATTAETKAGNQGDLKTASRCNGIMKHQGEDVPACR